MRKQITDIATKKIKERFMTTDKSKSERTKLADSIVRNHVLWSMGVSFIIPIPIADIFAVSALQLDMIRQLSRAYDIDFGESQGKAIISSLSSSTLAKAGATSLVKLVPGVGTLIGGATVSLFNGASTYALGEVFKRHYDSGGTILDFDTDRLKKVYKEKFEKGKTVVKEWSSEEKAAKAKGETTTTEPTPNIEEVIPEIPTETTDVVSQLKDLAKLREDGVITEKEFKDLKKKLLG